MANILFDQIDRRIIIAVQQGKQKPNSISRHLDLLKSQRELLRAINETWLFKSLKKYVSPKD